VITHDTAVARRMPRRIEMLDGRVVSDTTSSVVATSTSQPMEHP